MGLVLVIDAVSERFTSSIKDHRQVGASMVLQQPRQHVAETEHCIHVHAIRALHVRDRVEGPEDEPRAVDQDELQCVSSAPSPSRMKMREQ